MTRLRKTLVTEFSLLPDCKKLEFLDLHPEIRCSAAVAMLLGLAQEQRGLRCPNPKPKDQGFFDFQHSCHQVQGLEQDQPYCACFCGVDRGLAHAWAARFLSVSLGDAQSCAAAVALLHDSQLLFHGELASGVQSASLYLQPQPSSLGTYSLALTLRTLPKLYSPQVIQLHSLIHSDGQWNLIHDIGFDPALDPADRNPNPSGVCNTPVITLGGPRKTEQGTRMTRLIRGALEGLRLKRDRAPALIYEHTRQGSRRVYQSNSRLVNLSPYTYIDCLALDPLESLIATGSWVPSCRSGLGMVRVFMLPESPAGPLAEVFRSSLPHAVKELRFAADSRLLAARTESSVLCWRVSVSPSGMRLDSVWEQTGSGQTAIAFPRLGSFALWRTEGDSEVLTWYETEHWKVTHERTRKRPPTDPVLAFSSDATAASYPDWDSSYGKRIGLWDADADRLLEEWLPTGAMSTHQVTRSRSASSRTTPARVLSAAYSPYRKQIAFGISDGSVQLLNLGTLSSQRLCGHSNGVNQVAYSTDGRILASTSYDMSVALWDAS